jgi:hypothetical protein
MKKIPRKMSDEEIDARIRWRLAVFNTTHGFYKDEKFFDLVLRRPK